MSWFIWSQIIQLTTLLLIIAWALFVPEHGYVEVIQNGGWSKQNSLDSSMNRLIYMKRFLRRGLGVGLVFGLCAAFVTWIVR